MSCICTCRKRIFKIRRCPSFSRNASVRFPTERESSGPGTRAPRGTRSGNIPRPSVSHHSQVKKTSRKWCELLLTKNSNDGEETQSWARPPYASSHRELLEGPIFTLLTADFFFFLRKGHSHSTYCLPFVCSIVYHPKEQQIHFRSAQRWGQSSFSLSLD